jgi:hypothetical protein
VFNPCGKCTACCSGVLAGNTYGNVFNEDKQCVFLVDEQCTIYDTRPEVCRKYQCAWSQGIIPDWLSPIESNVLISVEVKDNKQYLKVLCLTNEKINTEIITFLDEWTKQTNTYYTVVEK